MAIWKAGLMFKVFKIFSYLYSSFAKYWGRGLPIFLIFIPQARQYNIFNAFKKTLSTEYEKGNENSLYYHVQHINIWNVQLLKDCKYRNEDKHSALNRVRYNIDDVIKCDKVEFTAFSIGTEETVMNITYLF